MKHQKSLVLAAVASVALLGTSSAQGKGAPVPHGPVTGGLLATDGKPVPDKPSSIKHGPHGTTYVYAGGLVELTVPKPGQRRTWGRLVGNRAALASVPRWGTDSTDVEQTPSNSDGVDAATGEQTITNTTATYANCPTGASCLYQDANFSGRQLTFRSAGYWQNLTDYGFNDAATSVVNNRGARLWLSQHTNGGGRWRVSSRYSYSTNVGSVWNDQASAIWLG